jgi:hypothetical protein
VSFQVIQMSPRTLSWWSDERDEIDLEPVYQRKGHVWNERQKQYLIDSILNGFDIPKLYVADFTFLNSELNTARKKYAVIDGKQRLLAIYDFFDDQLTLPKGFSYIEDNSLKLDGFSYSDLVKNHPKIARKFDNSSLTVMSVITDDDSKINELFVRLNTSKPLTGAEVRNAMGGKLPDIIRDLVAHSFFTSRIKFNVARSQDKNTAAKLLLLEHRGSIVDTKKRQLDALVMEATDTDDTTEIEDVLIDVVEDTEDLDVERSAKRMKSVLDSLSNIFIEADPLLRQQAQIVVIYWLVRDLDKNVHTKVRPFLLEFEAEREKAKQAPSGTADPEFSEYELMARTSNDAYSIRRRAQILQQRFEMFRKAKP